MKSFYDAIYLYNTRLHSTTFAHFLGNQFFFISSWSTPRQFLWGTFLQRLNIPKKSPFSERKQSLTLT